jgi:hypothetical protein
MAGISDFNPTSSGKAFLGLVVTFIGAAFLAGWVHGLFRKKA